MKAAIETKLFLTACLVYGFYVTMTSPFNNVDALCVAMVERGSFEMDVRVMHDYAVVEGRKYSGYSPGLSWLLVPLYAVLKPLCRVAPSGFQFQFFSIWAAWLVTIPVGGFCVVALHRWLREHGTEARPALLTALVFAFGTMWFVYARRHNSYSFLSAALTFLAFFLLDRTAGRSQGRYDALVAGFLVALGVAVDYKNAITAFWICVFVLARGRDWKSWILFAFGALPLAVAVLAYNAEVFGHPLHTPAKFEVARAGEVPLQPGLIPLEGALDFRWEYFWKLLVGPHTGFFLYMPVMVLAVVGAWQARNRERDVRWVLIVAGGIFLSNLLLSASLDVFWHGGGTINYYGPASRYLLPAVPFLMLLVGIAAARVRPAWFHLLAGLSVAVMWMFVLSASYGMGQTPIGTGWDSLPFVVHARHIGTTLGAESVWFNFLASSHFPLGTAGAAAITWFGLLVLAAVVWWIWRTPKTT